MLTFKNIKKFFTGLLLLTTFVSFSGFSDTIKSIQVNQTELVSKRSPFSFYEAKNYHTPKTVSHKKVTYNQYTLFNFKSLLKIFNFDFEIRFKTQKEMVITFETINNLLEQNLIASALSKDTSRILIK